MKKPVLVVMAAGLGSRYGGLKQMDPVDEEGRVILDYSVDDAVRVGFEEAIFIIRPEMEQPFEETIGRRIKEKIRYGLAFQRIDDLPAGFTAPKERKKPWGTGHAVLAARDEIGERSFVVVNADDYYGSAAYRLIFDFLTSKEPKEKEIPTYAFVAYNIENTVTENGSVARGVCVCDKDGYLKEIRERTKIEKRPYGAAYTEDDGATWIDIPKGTPVSMNFWGFTSGFLKELEEGFSSFLKKDLKEDPLGAEYFLPFAVDAVRSAGKARVKLLSTSDKWYGVTYKEDKPALEKALKEIRKKQS